ncbi:hypothetical protein OIU76_000753 [Salix suchowensis]|nr:hypothetical protein OIU76_000753 [Salix suchowensis]
MRQQVGNGPQLYCKQPQLQGPSHQTTGIAPGEIETGRQLEVPEMAPPKVPYKICPDPSAIIWRSRKSKRRGGSCINI